MKKVILFFSFASCSFPGFCQNDSVVKMSRKEFNDRFEEASLMLSEQFYDSALSVFKLLHKVQPANANINYKIGYIYLQSQTEKTKSIPYLEQSVTNISRNYRDLEPGEKHSPEITMYYLAIAYHIDYQFDKSIDLFQKFDAIVPAKNKDVRKDIAHRIAMCQAGKELTNVPLGCIIMNLGDSVNSEFADYSPVISADESAVYFTSRRKGTGGTENKTFLGEYYEDIWECDKKEDGTWGSAHSIGSTINTLGHEAVVGLSADGQTLFIYKDDNGDGNIYESHLNGDAWGYPDKMSSSVNSSAWEPSACISADGQTLYFVSDRKGGFGGRDIWRCVKLPNGQWSLPTNLGPKINTEYDEDAPFIHPDGITLFFSSKGHKTMGGFDIFFSTKIDSGWTEPANMGYPINTTGDDIYYVVSSDGKRAYFSSVREGGLGDKDIYKVTFPQAVAEPVIVFVGYIKNVNGNPLSDDNAIHITSPNGAITDFKANTKTGKYVLPLKPNNEYRMDVHVDTVKVFSRTIEVPNIETDHEITLPTIWLGSVALSGTLTDINDKGIPGSHIVVMNNKTKEKVIEITPKADGSYYLSLPRGTDYNISYEAEGYLFQSYHMDFSADRTYSERHNEVVLEKIHAGIKITLNNIFFDTGKSSLRQESTIELKRVIDLMKENHSIKVEISGHTDSRGKLQMNLSLSQSRAQSVVNYLKQRGISSSRLIAKGYGPKVPVAVETNPDGSPNEEGMQLNRRVEMKIIESK